MTPLPARSANQNQRSSNTPPDSSGNLTAARGLSSPIGCWMLDVGCWLFPLLLTFSVLAAPAAPPVPKLVLPPPTTSIWYFAATAVDASGLESDYSTEAEFVTTNDVSSITLAWDASPSTNHLTYRLYTGGTSRTYTNMMNVGTNLVATARLAPPPLTNLLLRVTTINATNLQWSATPRGPWTLLGATNLVATNVPSPRYYRALGRSRSTKAQSFIKTTPF